MKFSKKLIFLAIFVVMLFLANKTVSASAGEFNLRNRVGEDARCTVYSVLMQDNNYNILLDCRDITYPGGESVFSYVVWAQPTQGGNPFKLGTVGFGKSFFKTKTPFSSVFVTKETSSNARTPSGTTIMQGNLQRNDFLDGQSQVIQDNEPELSEPTAEPTPTSAPRNLGRIFAAGGVLAFIAIFGVILVIFVITRK